MSGRDVGIAGRLRAAGLRVVEVDGWQTRGSTDFDPRGSVNHHTAGPASGATPSLNTCIHGRPDLPGPLCNVFQSREADGRDVAYVVAAGRANHAGEGSWYEVPRDQGNSYLFGIECDHTANEQWYQQQALSGVVGIRALADHLGILDTAGELRHWFMAHKEYAPTRKVDPDPLDMDALRAFIFDPPPLPEGFMRQIRKTSTQEQTIRPSTTWTALRIDEEGDEQAEGTTFGVVAGPSYFVLHCAVTTEDGGGGAVMIRAVNTQGDRDHVVAGHPIAQFTATDPGAQHYGYSAQGHVPEGQWLRLQVQADDEVHVAKVETRATLW